MRFPWFQQRAKCQCRALKERERERLRRWRWGGKGGWRTWIQLSGTCVRPNGELPRDRRLKIMLVPYSMFGVLLGAGRYVGERGLQGGAQILGVRDEPDRRMLAFLVHSYEFPCLEEDEWPPEFMPDFGNLATVEFPMKF